MLGRLGCGTSNKRQMPPHNGVPPIENDDSDTDDNIVMLVAIPVSVSAIHMLKILLPKSDNPRIINLAETISNISGIPAGKQELYYRDRLLKDLTKKLEDLKDFKNGKSHVICYSVPSILAEVATKLAGEASYYVPNLVQVCKNLANSAGMEHRNWFREQQALRRRKTQKPDYERANLELHSAFSSTAADAAIAASLGQLSEIGNVYFPGIKVVGGGGVVVIDFESAEVALYPPASGEMGHKIAGHEYSGLNTLTDVHNDVLVPLHALVDWCGHRYVVIAASPVSPPVTLKYGSTASALVVRGEKRVDWDEKKSADSEFPGTVIGQKLNLSRHRIVERGSNKELSVAMPVLVEWHEVDGAFVPLNAMAVHPPDIRASKKPDSPSPSLITERLRPEFVKTYGRGQTGTTQLSYTHYESAAPVKCDVCGTVVTTQHYMSNGEYDVCAECMANEQNRITVDVKSLSRIEVPESAMAEFWVHEDGHVCFQKPTIPVPLNSDACQITLGFGEPSGMTELQRAHSVLYNETLPQMLVEMGGCVDRKVPEHCTLSPIGGAALVNEMHNRGMNVRMLGCITKKSVKQHVKWMAEAEIVARCCVVLLRKFLLDGTDLHARVAAFLTELTRALVPVEGDPVPPLFTQISDLASSKYHIELKHTCETGDMTSSCISNIHVPSVLHRVCEKTGIVLRRPKNVFAVGYPLPWSAGTMLTPSDIKSVKVLVKDISVNSTVAERAMSEAQSVHEKACSDDDWIEASQAYRRMISIVQYVYGTNHKFVTSAYAAFGSHLMERLRIETSESEKKSRWNPYYGREYDKKLFSEAEFVWEHVYDLSIEANGYIHESTTEACHALALLSGCEDISESSMAIKRLTEASLITETLVGVCHPNSALLWWECGHFYAECGAWLEASACMRRSLAGSSRAHGVDSSEVQMVFADLIAFGKEADDKDQYSGLSIPDICALVCDGEGLPPPPPPPPKPVKEEEKKADKKVSPYERPSSLKEEGKKKRKKKKKKKKSS